MHDAALRRILVPIAHNPALRPSMIHEDIRNLLEAPPTGDRAPTLDHIEHTLTSGYARALALEAGSAEAHLMMGYTRLKQNRINEALFEFQKASGLDSADPVSLCMVGYVHEKAGRTDQAIQCYAKALKIRPGDELATKLMASIDPN